MYYEEQERAARETAKQNAEKKRSERLRFAAAGLLALIFAAGEPIMLVTPFFSSFIAYLLLYRRKYPFALIFGLVAAFLIGGGSGLCAAAIQLVFCGIIYFAAGAPCSPVAASALGAGTGALGTLLCSLLFSLPAEYALRGVLSALIAFVFCFALFPAASALFSPQRKSSWSSREQLSLSISAAALTLGLARLSIFGVSPMYIMFALLSLVLLRCASLAASLSYTALTICLLCLRGSAEPYLLCAFLPAVIAAGLKIKSGRLAEAALFLTVAGTLCSILLSGAQALLMVLNLSIAGALYLFLAFFVLDRYMNGKPAADRLFVFMNEAVDLMLKEEIDSQRSMLSAISRNIGEDELGEETPVRALVRELASTCCCECADYERCWLKEGEATYDALSGVLSSIGEGNAGAEAFAARCEHSFFVIRLAGSIYERLRLTSLQKVKMNRFKRLMNIRIAHLSSVLLRLYTTLSAGMAIYRQDSADALSAMQNEGISLCALLITEDFSHSLRIFAKSEAEPNEEQLRTIGADILTEITGKQIIYTGAVDETDATYRVSFAQEYDYRLSVGISRAQKAGTVRCGDNTANTILSGGTQLLAICDGMGSGSAAARQSSRVLNMLEELLACGSEQTKSIETVNSILALEEDSETFTTLDLLLVDLSRGNAEFIKAGAAPSFIRSGGSISRISLDTLPIGILEETHTASVKTSLSRGDYIYLMSDGFLDAFKTDAAIREILEAHDSRSPQKIADELVAEAERAYGGTAADDITVVVAKVR